MGRRAYLDWLRGIAVLVMIEAHTIDAWTRLADRDSRSFAWAIVIAGYGAPMFLFLAGVALVLAAGKRMRRGASLAEAARLARRRGWQIFGLAFLFRVQSWVISGGPATAILKADILNIMGLSMLAAALIWQAGRNRWGRALLFAGAAAACTLVTPLIRESVLLASLPDRLEGYVRPTQSSTFSLFPWAGFLFAGSAVGLWLDHATSEKDERRANLGLALVGALMAAAAYAAPWLPTLYGVPPAWPGSPAFFLLRLGVVIALVPVSYAWTTAWRGHSPIQYLGLWSFFVYWIHVELVYGVVSTPFHKQLSFNSALLGLLAVTACMYGLARLAEVASTTRFMKSARDMSRLRDRFQITA